jgi:hypothetical protein
MLKSENEAWIFLIIIITIFLHNMLRLVVGHRLLSTTLTIVTHINHVHSSSNCPSWGRGSNFSYDQMNTNSPVRDLSKIPMFTIRTGGTILIYRGKLKPWEIVLPNTMICTIPSIRRSITNLPLLHPTIIRHKDYHWKKHFKHSFRQATEIYKSLRR